MCYRTVASAAPGDDKALIPAHRARNTPLIRFAGRESSTTGYSRLFRGEGILHNLPTVNDLAVWVPGQRKWRPADRRFNTASDRLPAN